MNDTTPKPDRRTCLSIWQPWAWLLTHGLADAPIDWKAGLGLLVTMPWLKEGGAWKDVENRTWTTGYRGLLYVHAGKTFDGAAYQSIKEEFPELPLPSIEELGQQMGGLVGTVRLVEIVTDSTSVWANPGCFHFRMVEGKPMDLEPMRGYQKLFHAGDARKLPQIPPTTPGCDCSH